MASAEGDITRKLVAWSRGDEPALNELLPVVYGELRSLAALNERQSRTVELRFFGGLRAEETAAVLGVSAVTVKREWRAARAWLFRAVGAGGRGQA